LEIINEVFILVNSLVLFCFTDFVQDEDVKTIIGYSVLFLIFTCMAFNLSVAVYFALKSFHKKCSRRRERRMEKQRALAIGLDMQETERINSTRPRKQKKSKNKTKKM